MAGEKETIMILKVDLQCPCCYKKIKKILCKFPQIRDQVYDEKGNKVTITVVCCNPEKIRDKLCCKGAKVIKCIEIKEPEKPKAPEKPKVVVIEKPKEPEKPKVVVIEKPKEPEKPKSVVIEKPKAPEKPKEPEKPKVVVVEKPKEPEKPKVVLPIIPPKEPEPVPFQGFLPLYPVRTCCGQCYGGHDGGPCYQGYGVPAPPPPCYDGYGYGYGYGRRDYHMRCDYYVSEENPSSCSIM